MHIWAHKNLLQVHKLSEVKPQSNAFKQKIQTVLQEEDKENSDLDLHCLLRHFFFYSYQSCILSLTQTVTVYLQITRSNITVKVLNVWIPKYLLQSLYLQTEVFP